jgi:hypothetical protein
MFSLFNYVIIPTKSIPVNPKPTHTQFSKIHLIFKITCFSEWEDASGLIKDSPTPPEDEDKKDTDSKEARTEVPAVTKEAPECRCGAKNCRKKLFDNMFQ